jgi:hypothetical protein
MEEASGVLAGVLLLGRERDSSRLREKYWQRERQEAVLERKRYLAFIVWQHRVLTAQLSQQ